MTLEEMACVLTKDLEPGFYNLGFAVRVHDDRGVEVMAMLPACGLPADDIAALQALHAINGGASNG